MLKAMIPLFTCLWPAVSVYVCKNSGIDQYHDPLQKIAKNYPDMQAASLSMSDPMEILQDIRRCCGGEKTQTDRPDYKSYSCHANDKNYE